MQLIRPLACAWLCLPLVAVAQNGNDNVTVNASIVFAPEPTCLLSLPDKHSVQFGVWYRGVGSVIYDPTGGRESVPMSDNLARDSRGDERDPTLGRMMVSVSHVASYNVRARYTPDLSHDQGENTLSLRPLWAYRESPAASWQLVSTDVDLDHTHTWSAPAGTRPSITHYFQFGGVLSGFTESTAVGRYRGQISYWVSCA